MFCCILTFTADLYIFVAFGAFLMFSVYFVTVAVLANVCFDRNQLLHFFQQTTCYHYSDEIW